MGSSASKYFEIPKFFLFSEKGIYSGSAEEKDFNYKVVPNAPKEGDKTLRCYTWHGRNCIDMTENVDMHEYPLTEEGYRDMLAMLEELYISSPQTRTAAQIRAERAEYLSETYLDIDDYMSSDEAKAHTPAPAEDPGEKKT